VPGEGPGATTGGPQVIGHERAGITFGTCNPEGMALKALREVVEKIGYKGLRAWRSLWNVTDLADLPTGEPPNTWCSHVGEEGHSETVPQARVGRSGKQSSRPGSTGTTRPRRGPAKPAGGMAQSAEEVVLRSDAL